MPLNVPAFDDQNITTGPAVAFIGATGATPTTSFGGLGSDGMSVSFESDTLEVTQGNPMVPQARFITSQTIGISLSSNEWDFTRLRYALGGGTVTTIPATDTFDYGASPCPIEAALHLRHSMCKSGHTLNIYAWKVAGSGNTEIEFSADTQHEFTYDFTVLLAQTEWSGAAIPDTGAQMIRIVRELT